MAEQCRFQLQQIVWAKVPLHPWWPGRIVEQFMQSKQLIHRIHFFGDPSFCYLATEQLLDFNNELPPATQQISSGLQLQRPISLATAANRKMQMSFKPQQSQQSINNNLICSMPDEHQEFQLENKGRQCTQLTFNSATQKDDCKQQELQIVDIAKVNEETVIDVLSSQQFQSLKSRKGYNYRKQHLALKHKLVQTVLRKYKLHDISGQCNRRIIHTKLRVPIRKPNRHKKRSGKSSTSSSIVEKCVKKLNKEIQKSVEGNEGRALAVRMVEKAEGECGRGNKQFRQMFRSMMMWLNRTKPIAINSFQELNTGLEYSRKEDEDKSKATQTGLTVDLP